jgi:predicted hotdog family 3-hydroxylacyl-ACP dehydratase
MVLVDRLIEATADGVVCAVSFSHDSVYASANGVPNVVVLECMAQAVSVLVGLSNRRKGEPTREGYLISVTNAWFDVDGFAIGAKLRVSAKRTWEDVPFASFECKTSVDDDHTEAASATLNVYQIRPVEEEL